MPIHAIQKVVNESHFIVFRFKMISVPALLSESVVFGHTKYLLNNLQYGLLRLSRE